ncbi:MAG: DNA-binding transcriptional regulator [Planctomycetia bacterium]|nr:DNA-binding transcriptional regulator [Planctomycetia bacterium]
MTTHPPIHQRSSRTELPRVALLVETSREVGRSILRGIERYARLYGPWSFHLFPGDLAQQLSEVKTWDATGIIARIETPEIAEAVLESRLPLVALDLYEEQKSMYGPFRDTPEVFVNSPAVGHLAAEYLMNLHLEHFAFVGEISDVLWSREREKGFQEKLRRSGFTCRRYTPSHPSVEWREEIHDLGAWLQELPKPVGIFAGMDVRGRQVLAACQEYGIRVPNDAAVLGVDNDPLLCRMCTPPMSSIVLDSENGGYQAAAILDDLMKGKTRYRKKFLINPLRVAARESTQRSDIDDDMVADAVRFIRMNSMIALSVQEVVNQTSVSRRVLEVRFRKALDRTILSEINRARVERVKQLLANTDMKVSEIAEACEFGTDGYLCRFFLRETGMTIGEYRRQNLKRPGTA